MCKTIFIIAFFLLNIAFAFSKNLDESVGVPAVLKLKNTIQRTNDGAFYFKQDEYPSRTMTRFLSTEFSSAILPPENSVMAIWYGESTLKYSVGKRYVYIVAPKSFGEITKEKLNNKKIVLTLNTALDFYLEKFLAGIPCEKINKTTSEIVALFGKDSRSKHALNDVVIMEESIFHNLKNKEGVQVLRIDGGNYYYLTSRMILSPKVEESMHKAFADNGLDLIKISQEDTDQLNQLSLFLPGKSLDKNNFEKKLKSVRHHESNK